MRERTTYQGEIFESLFEESLHRYLTERNWSESICQQCGSKYYSKTHRSNCGNHSCVGKHEFLNFSRKKEYTFLEDLANHATLFFLNNGYESAEAVSIISPLGDTLFTVAGVQLLDKIIHLEESTPKSALFVAQPVIRMKFWPEVGKTEGISTSFVNVCTEEVSPTTESHIKNLDSWLGFLSYIGIFVGDITLSLRKKDQNWGKGSFKNIIIDVNYGGLQLGDASLLTGIPQETREDLTISDIGFGLERLCWALNKTCSYFDSIGTKRLSFTRKFRLIDSLRTMTLLASSGLEPSNRAQGYRFRQLSKGIINFQENIPWLETIPKYHKYWSKFIPSARSVEECLGILKKEYNRNWNGELASRLGMQSTAEEEPENFIELLLRKGAKIDKIKEILVK